MAMNLSKEEVLKIIFLARLSTKEENLDQMINDFNNVLNYVDALSKVNVDNIEPLAHVHESYNIYREDVCGNGLTTEEALLNTSDRSGSFIRVPLIIEGES